MFKKIFTYILFLIAFLAQTSIAQAAKITNINFDNSNNLMFIGTNAHELECNNIQIKPIQLREPDRVYFDVPNSILSSGNQTWVFKNTAIQQIKAAQFSVNPNIVRFVIYYNRNYNPDDIKIYCSANNSLSVVLNNGTNAKNNTISIYRTQNNLNSDLYETTVYATEDKIQKISNNLDEAPSNTNNLDALAQIQKAIGFHTSDSTEPFNLILDREFELKSNYFLKKVDIKRGNALISGVGNVEITQPFTLTNPSRLVIDLPNTVVAQKIRNKDFQLTETDSIKIGQFEPSKARIVITSPTPEKYLSIKSIGSQSLFIGHENRLSGLKFAENNAQLTSLKSTSSNDFEENFTLKFDKPIIPAIKKTDSNFELSIFNIQNFDIDGLKKAAKSTKLQTLKVEKVAANCLKFIFPIKNGTQINVYELINNKQLEVKFVLPKNNVKKAPTPNNSKKNEFSKVIVIDAGHGGSDVGAIKNNIYEKDLNLPVALKVKNILSKKGYTVHLTRDTDVFLSLQERVDFTIEHNADVFVSIHANSCAKPEISGIETHYYKNIDYELAQNIHNSIIRYVSAEDRGLFKSKFYVIRHNEIPSVLLEMGFMTNQKELEDMQSEKRQNEIANAIAEGIINYLLRK